MKRRDLIAVLSGAAMTWPLWARAQQRDGMRHLGVLMRLLANDPEGHAYAAALVQGLGALDWKEEVNLRIDWRRAGGEAARYERYVAELVALGPEVLLAEGSPSIEALRRRTTTIPIVFTVVADPVGQGFVASLAHPGGTITGFSGYDPPMATKWLGMLTQITPRVERVAVLFNPAIARQVGPRLRAIEDAAPSAAVTVRAAPVHDEAEIGAVMAGLAREERGGLLVLPDVFVEVRRDAIVALASRYRLPAVYPWRYYVTAGGLMSYGFDQPDLFRQSAAYVDRILKGAKPADLPVQAPTKFELVVNLKTAKALGITVAPTLLATADEVIE
jgi:putative ABC transport system substrate-binding protein